MLFVKKEILKKNDFEQPAEDKKKCKISQHAKTTDIIKQNYSA